MTFDDCGHYPHHERPGEFLNALREFLDDPTVRRVVRYAVLVASSTKIALR